MYVSNCEPCLLDMGAYGGSLYKVRELKAGIKSPPDAGTVR